MKDFNVGNITSRDIKSRELKNTAESRQSDPSAKSKAAGQEFIKTLESAVSQIQEASQGTRVAGSKADASAIKQEVNAANESYAKMMKAGQMVSQLYHNMNLQKNDK